MQFSSTIVAFAAMAAAASAETVTVYACSSTAVSSGFVAPSGTIGSTGVVTAPTATGSPITYATGAASMKTVSGLAVVVAGGVALFL